MVTTGAEDPVPASGGASRATAGDNPAVGVAAPLPERTRIRRALNDILIRSSPPIVLAANPLVAALLLLPLWATPAAGPLVIVVLLLGLNNLIAFLVYRRYQRAPEAERDRRAFQWCHLFFIVSLGNSVFWGLGGLWVFVLAPVPERFLVGAVILGMSAGMLACESASFRQVAGFVLLAVPPIALHGLASGTPIGLTYGFGMLFYIGVMLYFAKVNNDAQVQTVRLRFAHHATLEALHRTVATLEAAQAHLSQADKMASLGRLVAGMAHEINTPVGNAITAVSLVEARAREAMADLEAGALRRGALERTLRHCAEAGAVAESNLRRAGDLINSFRDVAVDRASARRRTINLAEYLAEVLISLRPRVRATPHAVGLTCDPDLTLDSYPGALSQVVTNLVINALTHAFEPDGPPGTITVTGRADGPDHVRLMVADDGRGIDPSVRDCLFEPFVTTNRSGGGTGLGMGIALTQVSQVLGGSLSVDSAPSQGTRVYVRLPRVAPSHDAPGTPDKSAAEPVS